MFDFKLFLADGNFRLSFHSRVNTLKKKCWGKRNNESKLESYPNVISGVQKFQSPRQLGNLTVRLTKWLMEAHSLLDWVFPGWVEVHPCSDCGCCIGWQLFPQAKLTGMICGS